MMVIQKLCESLRKAAKTKSQEAMTAYTQLAHRLSKKKVETSIFNWSACMCVMFTFNAALLTGMAMIWSEGDLSKPVINVPYHKKRTSYFFDVLISQRGLYSGRQR